MDYNKLYNQNETDFEISNIGFHKCILKTIDYFENVFKYQNELELIMSEKCAFLFKKWLYNQKINSDELDIEVGKECFDVSKYLDIQFYTNSIKNPLFKYVIESKDSDVQFEYFKHFDIYDNRFSFSSVQVSKLNKEGYHYAVCLEKGNGCEKNEEKAFSIYLKNKKDSKYLHRYASCLRTGTGCVKNEIKSSRLFKLNWKKNKNSDSLHSHAINVANKNTVKSFFTSLYLFKLNWEENKNNNSLHSYTYQIDHIPIDYQLELNEKIVDKLYKQNWEENKDMNSLYLYAINMEENNMTRALELHRQNWLENKHTKSKTRYSNLIFSY